ncbi:MAG: hypothetical protein H8Z69_00950 [Nanohaloarchaea archaeon]|nr:hypothetical protein [Candidatus Nanohaloarchaea archaeon]
MSLEQPKGQSNNTTAPRDPPEEASWEKVGDLLTEVLEESEQLVSETENFFELLERTENGFLEDLKRKVGIKKKVEDLKAFEGEVEEQEEILYHYLGTFQSAIQKTRKSLYLTSRHKVSGRNGLDYLVEQHYDDVETFVESDPDDILYHASVNSSYNQAARGYEFDPRIEAAADVLVMVDDVESKVERVEGSLKQLVENIKSEIEEKDSRDNVDHILGVLVEKSRKYEELERMDSDLRRAVNLAERKMGKKPLNHIT